ncbi:MAG: HD domain-containing protein [Clostridiales bacterium]|jgi:3'-5' exoribonuclease|nr:HD domain-containing protein [Clostridiales bacterium]
MQRDVISFAKGETVEGYYIIKSVNLRTSNTNNRYYDLTIADKTGEVNGKIWDPQMVEDMELQDGMLVKLRGLVNEWQGQLQIKVERIRRVNAGDRVRIEDFVPAAPYPPEDMLKEVLQYLVKIKNKDIRQIASILLNENREKLLHYPAAMKNHHSIRSGLLYHITTMLKMAERVLEVYSHLNADLLYAGVILHDLAKIHEMNANDLGMVTSYTTEGILLGHIVQGIKDIERVGSRINADRETVLLLQHMILSHHNEPEYGSPKRPMIPEGEVLHYLDMLDARMYDMQKALDSVKPGEFSEKVWLLNNRQMYRPVFQENDERDSNHEY